MPIAKVPLFALIAGAFVFGHASSAQQPPAAAPGGTVTGHVLCGDTRRPARFAGVMLFGVPKDVLPAPKLDDNADASQVAAAMKSAMGSMNLVQTQTGMDGSFTANNVAPGDYYVFASVAGYVQPTNLVQAALDAGADPSKPIPGVLIVHVAAERTSQADVTIDRGAAISGKVVWDDGSPAAHAIVSAVSPNSKADKQLPPQFNMLAISGGLGGGGLVSISDDLGHFRIAGLSPGDYLVKVMFQTNSQFAMQGGVMNLSGAAASTPLTIYASAAFHKADAKAVTLHTAEDRGDEEVTIKLSGLRTVSGRVTSLEDHHGLNSGTVQLQDAQDKEFTRSAGVDANGNFSVTFVPPGTYNLTVSGGADTEPSKKEPTGLVKFSVNHTLRSYQGGKQSVIVGDNDVTGLSVELAPAKTTTKDLDLNDLIKN
jgi:hypothetical protein